MIPKQATVFFWEDWKRDTRCLSLAAKGAWIDILSGMWFSKTRGKLTMPVVAYAGAIGATVGQTETAIRELVNRHVCELTMEPNGDYTLINRRMVREEKARLLAEQNRGASNHAPQAVFSEIPESGEENDAGNKNKEKNKKKKSPPIYPLLEEKQEKKGYIEESSTPFLLLLGGDTRGGADDLFDQFWKAYPKKKAKPDAKKAWAALKPGEGLVSLMLRAIEAQKKSLQWNDGGKGEFIPYPARWLRGERWLDEECEHGNDRHDNREDARGNSGKYGEALRKRTTKMLAVPK